MRGDKRRGRGAAPAAIEASSRVQSPSLATVALEGKTYTVTPTAKRCTPVSSPVRSRTCKLCSAWERSSGRVIFLPRLVGTLRLWSSSETHSVRLVVAKIQHLDDQWCPMKLEDPGTEESFRFTTYGSELARPRAGGDPRG